MGRGIDTDLFRPERRARTDDAVVVGFVGRLMPEKNLRLLPRVAAALRAARIANFRFQITGAGSERPWLERNLPGAEFTGLLSGEPLAKAYANLDIFAFPSHTDTFGNVVQEALASGVPAVVTESGGPRFIVRPGVSGLVAASDDEFCARIVELARDECLRRQMGRAARAGLLSAGSVRGFWIEFAFRIAVGGFWGSLLQAFSGARPAWLAGISLVVLLPGCTHCLEYLALRTGGAAHAGAVTVESVAVSVASLVVNWGLMRGGILLTGRGAVPLTADLRRIFRGLAPLPPSGEVAETNSGGTVA
jgi:hypothetical protein